MTELRPLPEDPDAEEIRAGFDLASDEWFMAEAGEYHTAAAEGWKNDGSAFQRMVILEWPGRVNKSNERRTVRLAMHPEDALGLANVLHHTATWMMANQPS